MMHSKNIRSFLQKKQLRSMSILFIAMSGCAYFFYYYSFANRYEQLALAKPEQLESVRVLRYYSPEWYGMQSNWDVAQLQNGDRLSIRAKPMGVFTGFLVAALPIPNKYRTSYPAIQRSEQTDISLKPVNTEHLPLMLQINRKTGHVCYRSSCAQLIAVCPPSKSWMSPKDPPCQFFKH
jgi:hypothetical protein